MKYSHLLSIVTVVPALIGGFSACSLKDRSSFNLSVSSPKGLIFSRSASSVGAVAASPTPLSTSTGTPGTYYSPLPVPTSLTSFPCYAVNVIGGPISTFNPNSSCPSSTDMLGKYQGFFAFDGSDHDLNFQVPAGTLTVQVIGAVLQPNADGSYSCPLIDSLIGSNSGPHIQTYLLGQADVSVNGDAAVDVTISYDPANPKPIFNGCDNHGGPPPSIPLTAAYRGEFVGPMVGTGLGVPVLTNIPVVGQGAPELQNTVALTATELSLAQTMPVYDPSTGMMAPTSSNSILQFASGTSSTDSHRAVIQLQWDVTNYETQGNFATVQFQMAGGSENACAGTTSGEGASAAVFEGVPGLWSPAEMFNQMSPSSGFNWNSFNYELSQLKFQKIAGHDFVIVNIESNVQSVNSACRSMVAVAGAQLYLQQNAMPLYANVGCGNMMNPTSSSTIFTGGGVAPYTYSITGDGSISGDILKSGAPGVITVHVVDAIGDTLDVPVTVVSGSCGPMMGTLQLDVPNGSGAIPSNAKAAASLDLMLPPGIVPPPDQLNLVVNAPSGVTGTVKFCADPTCSGTVSNFSFSPTGQLQAYNGGSPMAIQPGYNTTQPGFLGIMTTYPVGTTFSVQVVAASGSTGWSGWNLPMTQFTVVGSTLSWNPPATLPVNNCALVDLFGSTSLSNETFVIFVPSEMSGAQTAFLYQDANCSLEVSGTPVPGGKQYTYSDSYWGINNGNTNTNADPTHQWFWIKNANPDSLQVMISTNDNSMVPVVKPLSFVVEPFATNVLGQSSYTVTTSAATATSMYGPLAIATNGTRLVVADRFNNRVLLWNAMPTSLDQPADLVLGQPDFISSTSGSGASNLNVPTGVATDGGHVVVVDANNNRVLIWNTWPTVNGQTPDVVLGQGSFTSNTPNSFGAMSTAGSQNLYTPYGVAIVNGNLVVTDTGNYRVLIYNNLAGLTTGAAASVVIGQPNMLTVNAPTCSASSFNTPRAVASNGTALVITDDIYHRAFVYGSIPSVNGAAPSAVLGQPDFVSCNQNANLGANAQAYTLNEPMGVTFDGATGRLYLADSLNSRVLYWNTLPLTNEVPATGVLGQPSLTSNSGTSGVAGLSNPTGVVTMGGMVFITDSGNNRVMVFPSP